MKKAEILQVLLRRFMVASVMVLGLMIGSSMSANAQIGTTDYYIAKLTDVKSQYVDLQQTFVPSSAKWDAVGDVIAHIDTTLDNLDENPNYIKETDGYAIDRKRNPVWMKIHPSILAEYSSAELAQMQAKLDQLVAEGASGDRTQKLDLILAANSY